MKNHDANKVNSHLLRSAIKPFACYRLFPFISRKDPRHRIRENNKNCKNQEMIDRQEKREKYSTTN
jgi:hypothetical protein